MRKGIAVLAFCAVLALAGCGDDEAANAGAAQSSAASGKAQAAEQRVFPLWTEICQKEPENTCILVRDVVEEKTQSRAWRGVISADRATKKGTLTIIVPLGVLTQAPLKISVDEGKVHDAKISHCTGNGCVATLSIDKALFDTLRGGKTLNTEIALPGDNAMRVGVGLDGFRNWSEGLRPAPAP